MLSNLTETPRILAVDDERHHLNIIVELLSSDYKVIAAKSGEKALEIAASETPPDLILLDILMPEMDGYEVCKRLKQNEQTRDIPVIFLTIKSDVADETHGFEMGAVDYIAKPFSPPIVRARIRTHLALNHALVELGRQNEQLEIEVVKRTKKIRQAHKTSERLQIQLQQAQKMQSIGLLTNGIAHDFNNFLSVTTGFTELALQRPVAAEDETLRRYLHQISEASERASKLVQQLLAFSRGASTTGQPLELAPVVTDAVNLMQPILPSTISIETDLNDHLPAIVADKVQLCQVIMNLCINARDAMKNSGKLMVRIVYGHSINEVCTACGKTIHGDFIELVVEDDGPGISPDLINAIFQPLVSSKEIGEGSGMGLAIVDEIVHSHHGHILLQSQPEAGTTFRILFPPAVAAAKIESDEISLESLATKNGHILVVCDDVSLALLLREYLGDAGYRVTVQNNAEKTLATINTVPSNFDLVIIDHSLPNLDGLILAREVAQLMIHLPVIVCTSDSSSIVNIDNTVFLARPFGNEKLMGAIHSLALH
ncbi:MAG: hypothetical protein DRQ60_00645 [Gammaproteobacteria bacterium]|nr:MAG: hypothetical protein DRQ54_02260 [Gammaproteobacteria bacterium]RLA15489.1 MAG: hypothetical protein DRQ52_01670 [Gammaproteobacteria bacterium]RLA17976.1 MAG: hypothetical protein DRQ60_00645 [Gammaproteobacteria bacterium]